MALLGRITLAALGMLAYQNRNKLSDLLQSADERAAGRAKEEPVDDDATEEDTIAQVAFALGMKDLMRRFSHAGYQAEVDSWVAEGANKPLSQTKVKAAIDTATLNELAASTGLSQAELIRAIAADLPEAVDAMTPGDDRSEEQNLLDDVPISRQ